jgi:MYXO-CTERM domain-containing protein
MPSHVCRATPSDAPRYPLLLLLLLLLLLAQLRACLSNVLCMTDITRP